MSEPGSSRHRNRVEARCSQHEAANLVKRDWLLVARAVLRALDPHGRGAELGHLVGRERHSGRPVDPHHYRAAGPDRRHVE
jgi:hypothetical protein